MLATVLLFTFPLLVLSEGTLIIFTQNIPHTIVQEIRDMPSSFGAKISPEGIHGFLVAGEPRNGCSPIKPPPANYTNFTKNWIVLLARYNCSFEVKVRNAQNAGYACAIIHNVGSEDLETMSAKHAEDITIPSVFVSESSGETLAYQYVYNQGFYILVDDDLPFDINTHLLLPFAIVVALCLVVMVIFMIIKCIKDRRRARRHRLPTRALRKIPTCKFGKGDPYDTCAICLDDYQDGDRLRVLPCAHAYHAKCIDPWLTENRRVCPVCKRRVLAAGERRRHSDSDDSRDPLVTDSVTPATQGGTFVEQRENPFVRAARFVSRLRRPQEPPSTQTQEERSDSENESGSIISTEDEAAPLVSASYSDELATRHQSINTTRGDIGVAAIPHHNLSL